MKIVAHCNLSKKTQRKLLEYFGSSIQLDESYFGDHSKGKRGRGTAGKVAAFGILKRGGKIYTQVVDVIPKRQY